MLEDVKQFQTGILVDIHGDEFELLEVLGEGGTGIVYKARQVEFDRYVAIKMLKLGKTSTTAVERLRKEAVALGQLNHPNIVQVYSFSFSSRNELFLVLELVDGCTLKQQLAARVYSLAEAKVLFGQILSALQTAHEAGFVHRDIKPSNIMVTNNGRPKVMDFGLVKAISGDSGTFRSICVQQETHGQLLGTPAYMSPEQCAGSATMCDRYRKLGDSLSQAGF